MWFNETGGSGRRQKKRRARNKRLKTVLHVSARSSTQRKVRMQRFGIALLVLILVVVGGAAGATGCLMAVQKLYTENPRFKVTHLDISGGEVVTPELIKECAGLHEGMNIFAVDIEKTRRDFLERASTIRRIEISRHLPSTLRVEVFERVPVARMGGHPNFVVDIDGVVFSRGRGTAYLPSLDGYQGPKPQSLSRLYGRMPAAALEVISACRAPELNVQLQSIDLSSQDVLRLTAVIAGGTRTVDLAWRGMKKRTRSGPENLERRLRKVVGVAEGADRYLQYLDATSDNIVGR